MQFSITRKGRKVKRGIQIKLWRENAHDCGPDSRISKIQRIKLRGLAESFGQDTGLCLDVPKFELIGDSKRSSDQGSLFGLGQYVCWRFVYFTFGRDSHNYKQAMKRNRLKNWPKKMKKNNIYRPLACGW